MATRSDNSVHGILSGHRPQVGVYDEIFDQEGNLRSHWIKLAREINRIGKPGLEHRYKQIRRMVRQNGIAYSGAADPAVREEHLQLDLLPQLIPAAEWQTIEEALQQRADLLNLILADLHGPRSLITSGILPAEVLFDHPHYHLPFHDLPTPGNRHLHFYAAELVRSPGGGWWIKSDRTGAPGGSGFALENRIAISRTFPNEFRRSNVPRLAPYFIALRDQLASLAKHNHDKPQIVMLSAGAGHKNYFEDPYLAQYLGFPVVEPEDLVVRLGRVMLKTLAGLTPVDVIFRRQPSHLLDPLELGGEAPGVPGILQVIRNGNVVVANAPGSGLVESPVFMAFMPRLCQALMNTKLLLPGVATWWGGEPGSLELMLDRIDEIHLLPAFRARSRRRSAASAGDPDRPNPKHLRPETMDRQQRLDLLQKYPADWVGQEKVMRSTSPVWENGGFRTGYLSMRTFLTATGDSWKSLPGGLVRISAARHESLRDPFQGGETKDAWVLADKPVVPTSLLKRSDELLKPSRSGGFLPSRVAENLCWLGRYLERADASARLLRAVIARLTGEADPEESVELPTLIRALALEGRIDADYAIQDFSQTYSSLADGLPGAVLNAEEPASLKSQVGQIVSLAGTVRDRLASRAWQIIQELKNDVFDTSPEQCDLADLLVLVDELIVNLAAFSGFVNEFMTRTLAFRFLNIGRRLEHALQIVALIKDCLAIEGTVSGELLEAILEISDSGLTYRARYYANLQLPAELDLLLLDETNPRSLAFQLAKLNTNLALLPGIQESQELEARILANQVWQLTRELDIKAVCRVDKSGKRSALTDFLDQVSSQLAKVFVSLSNRFLVHSGPVHQMIASGLDRREP